MILIGTIWQIEKERNYLKEMLCFTESIFWFYVLVKIKKKEKQ